VLFKHLQNNIFKLEKHTDEEQVYEL